MSCCPTGSWPQLQSSYKAQGTVTSLDGIEIYSVGTPNPKCIIWNYDIFGFDSGRSRQMCDLFAAEGYFVIMPDYFRGDWMDPTAPTFTYPKMVEFVKRTTTWSGVLESDCKKVLSYAKQHGAERFGAVGTCWGSYPVVKMAAWDEVKCGVSIHPSHGMLSKVLEEDEREMLSAVKCPQLFMPTGNDGPDCKHGGVGEEILKDKVTIIEFPDMEHGFSNRGDLKIENVKRDVTKAISEAIAFFKKHL